MEILNDKDLNEAVYSMVDDCKAKLILITPYFDPPESLKKRIVKAAKRGVLITLIVRDIRKEEHASLTSSTKNALDLMLENGVSVKWATWLHAKIYISEKNAIISSLNLLETSFGLSKETGVQFPSISSEFDETMKRAEELRRDAEDYIASISSSAQKQRLDEVAAGGGSAKKQRSDDLIGGGGRGECYVFQRGECNRGSECRFSHGGAGEAGDGFGTSGMVPSKCLAFQRGEVAAGGGSAWLHHHHQQQQQNLPQCLDCSTTGPQITADKPRCYDCWQKQKSQPQPQPQPQHQHQHFRECLDCSFRGPQITAHKPRCYDCWLHSIDDDSDYY